MNDFPSSLTLSSVLQRSTETFGSPRGVIDAPFVSLAIFAWNEEKAVPTLLSSLWQQSLFDYLEKRGLKAEILCVLNGCTDRTAAVAAEIFERAKREHPNCAAFVGRVVNLAERGKINAWNQYVHTLSAREARYLFMMDADIIIHPPDTLWNMLETLETDAEASVAVDVPCKDIAFKKATSWSDRLSLGMSHLTSAADGQLCGQLYGIRAEMARIIYLPKDLPACEDGLIKALVCTDLLEHEVKPSRIRLAPRAAHTFEAYTAPSHVLKNQKRQIIGQTAVHVLVDKHLQNVPGAERKDLALLLRAAEVADPAWLKKLIAAHLKETRYFWRLYPGLLSQRFRHLSRLSPAKRLLCLPAALASVAVGLLAALGAWKTLKKRRHRLLAKGRTRRAPRALALFASNFVILNQ